jgi:hypothetical protein
MTKPKVLVTRRWPAAVEAQLSEKFDVVLNRGDVPLMTHEFRQAFLDYDEVLMHLSCLTRGPSCLPTMALAIPTLICQVLRPMA